MKIILQLFLLLVLAVSSAGFPATRETANHPLPQHPDTLRILGVGNSFTDDGMTYLPELLEAAGIRNVILGRLYIGGCSLERHCREYASGSASYIYYKSTANRWETVSGEATLCDGLTDEPWDIVVLQQVSGLSGIYESYQPWFDRLVEIVWWYCPNAGACIAWQQTWSYAGMSDHADFVRYGKDSRRMYEAIVASVRQLMADRSVEVVIPSGTTIENLRRTELCDSLALTRDGYHLSLGAGRYAAACAWFETLVAPVFGVSLVANGCRLEGLAHELTPHEAELCRDAARRASIRRFSVWTAPAGSDF